MVRISRERMNMEDGRIDRASLKDHAEIALGSSSTVFTGVGGAYTIDVEAGNTYKLILNANCSFTFSNPTGSGNACSFTLILKQDWIGRRTVTWPAAIRWQSAVTPTLGVGSGDYDVFSFSTFDGGTTWFGFQAERDHLNGVGTLWGFGAGASGRLGNNSTASVSSPAQVGTLTDWISVIGGRQHTVALRSNGTLWSWGRASEGQLGHNSVIVRSSPTQIGSLTTWAMVSAGRYQSIALKTDGTIWTWGQSSNFGQLGHNSLIDRSSPTQVGALSTWTGISGGRYHNLAIKSDGTLWSWGRNTTGQLGHDSVIDRSSPTQVGSLTNWAIVNGGGIHTRAIKTDGTLWTWGSSSNGGQLGHNSTIARSSPTQVGVLTDWAAIGGGRYFNLAIKTDGTLWSWGQNNYGQLGRGTSSSNVSSPAQLGSETNWVAVGGGGDTAIALKANGTVWAWGRGTDGQIGDNIALHRSSPMQVGSDTNWSTISSGNYHSFVIRFP